MFRIGKTFKFCAAHFLPNHDGQCRNLHGHNYTVEVVLEGTTLALPDGPKEGMLLDFADLKAIVEPHVKRFDHNGLLQDLMSEARGCSTAELLCLEFFRLLKTDLQSPGNDYWLHSVRVKETETTFAEYIHDDCSVPS